MFQDIGVLIAGIRGLGIAQLLCFDKVMMEFQASYVSVCSRAAAV